MNRDANPFFGTNQPSQVSGPDELLAGDLTERLRSIAAHLVGGERDLLLAAANQLAYLWAQDGLLSKAQAEAERLRDELAEVERPLDEQMARLNASLTKANAANAALAARCEKAEVEARRYQWVRGASPSQLEWMLTPDIYPGFIDAQIDAALASQAEAQPTEKT